MDGLHTGIHAPLGPALRACARRALPAFALALALAFPPHTTAAPGWPSSLSVNGVETANDAPVRYTFPLPKRHPFCLIEIPARLPDGSFPAQFAARFSDKTLPVRIVHADETKVDLLIDASQALGGDRIDIYPVGHADVPPSSTTTPDIRSPQPIGGEFRRSRGTTIPLPHDVLFTPQAGLIRRQSPGRFMARDFEGINANVNNLRHERRGPPFSDGIVDIHTWLLVDQPGTYVFALCGHGASALWIGNGESLAATAFTDPGDPRQDDHPLPGWTLGREMQLEPGVYRLHAANFNLYAPSFSIGWLRPGATEIEELPKDRLLCGLDNLPFPRAEPSDAKAAVGFSVQVGAPYAFAGHTNVFAICNPSSRTLRIAPPINDPDTGTPLPDTLRWSVDGIPVDTPSSPIRIPLSAGRHEFVLNATLGGHPAVATNVVYVRGLPQREHLAAAALNGIPSLLHENDILRPDLWITGDFPSRTPVRAELTVHRRDGTTAFYTNAIELVQNWARLEGDPLPVSETDFLSWRLLHGVIVLDSGELRLQRPPFSILPVLADGDTLRSSDGTVLSYVLPGPVVPPADGGSPLPRPPNGSRYLEQLILLDDLFLPPAPAQRDLDDFAAAFGPSVRAIRLPSLRRDGGEAVSDLAPLCGLDAIPEGATVLLTLGSEAMADRIPTQTYQDRLLVLALLLRDARHATVAIATPPTLPGSTVPVRPYAAAALRAAALSGVPAIDLYSAFLTDPADTPLADGLRIAAPEGLRRAADTIRRAFPGPAAAP